VLDAIFVCGLKLFVLPVKGHELDLVLFYPQNSVGSEYLCHLSVERCSSGASGRETRGNWYIVFSVP